MTIEVKDSCTVITGADDIGKFRILAIRGTLKLELKGIKMIRGRSAFARIKEEFGLKGRNQAVYDAFCKMHGLEP